MYSTDNEGKYSENLDLLTPNYLKTIPECPSVGEANYGYSTGVNAPANHGKFEDYYFIKCKGDAHTKVNVPTGYPQYTGIEGLIER